VLTYLDIHCYADSDPSLRGTVVGVRHPPRASSTSTTMC